MRYKRLWTAICILIFTVGIIGSVYLSFCSHGQTVHIIQDGKILYTINLEQAENQIIEVEYQGSKNKIQIQEHQICVIDAECPDQICVKMGQLKSGVAPIVCLPNRLVIKFAENDDIDAEVK